VKGAGESSEPGAQSTQQVTGRTIEGEVKKESSTKA